VGKLNFLKRKRALTKAYGDFVAVADIDLDVQRGEIVAFLGPNGAGKATTVEILEGYRQWSAGILQVLGEDPAAVPLLWRDRIGIVLQESEIEPDLTARECVELYAGYHLHPRPVMETLALVGLAEQATTRGSRLSGGRRRRLGRPGGLDGRRPARGACAFLVDAARSLVQLAASMPAVVEPTLGTCAVTY
jgi:ABC-2 type transport system ATP-binding protein